MCFIHLIRCVSIWYARIFWKFHGILRARRGDEKFEQWVKCLLALYVKPSSKEFIIPLLFLFLAFEFYFAKHILRPYLCIVSILQGVSERQKQHQRNDQGVPCDQQQSLLLKSSFLLNSNLKTEKKSMFGSFSAAFLLLFIIALFYSGAFCIKLHDKSHYLRCKMCMHV